MGNITKHDSEEEGEGDGGEEARVSLFVLCDTISFNNFLCRACIIIGEEMGGQSFGMLGHKLSYGMFELFFE